MSEITRVESFKCPNCGAPIEYDGQGEKTVKCPFCGEPALVPAQLLPKESANRVYSSVDARQRVTRTSSGGAWGVALVPLILILVVIVVIVIIIFAGLLLGVQFHFLIFFIAFFAWHVILVLRVNKV